MTRSCSPLNVLARAAFFCVALRGAESRFGFDAPENNKKTEKQDRESQTRMLVHVHNRLCSDSWSASRAHPGVCLSVLFRLCARQQNGAKWGNTSVYVLQVCAHQGIFFFHHTRCLLSPTVFVQSVFLDAPSAGCRHCTQASGRTHCCCVLGKLFFPCYIQQYTLLFISHPAMQSVFSGAHTGNKPAQQQSKQHSRRSEV